MTKEEFAEMLNDREYTNEMNKEEEKLAKENGLIVVFGASDDLVELRGAIDDEFSCYEGTTLYFLNGDLLVNKCDDEYCPYYEKLRKTARKIDVIWAEYGYSWIYKTDIPHATFDIVRDNEPYCRGIVFNISSIISYS